MSSLENNPHWETLQELAQDPRNPIPSAAETPRLEVSSDQAVEILAAAQNKQIKDNLAAKEWLEGLSLSVELKEEIEFRLGQRGGSWLDFVENLIGHTSKGKPNQPS